jgi:hypothetical protein
LVPQSSGLPNDRLVFFPLARLHPTIPPQPGRHPTPPQLTSPLDRAGVFEAVRRGPEAHAPNEQDG